MPEIQFKRGEFRTYRAITKVHLGAIEDDLQEGEVVDFDGTVMRWGGQEHQVSTLRAAIKVGWLVPEEEEGGTYVARPAGVKIHDAQSTGRDRGTAREMGNVADEERDLGHLSDVRPDGAPETHVAARSGEVSRPGRTGAQTTDAFEPEATVTADGMEGVAVGKFKSSAKAKPVAVTDRAATAQALREATKDGAPQVIKPKTSGDVDEARAGDELDELLPDAASSGKPQAGVAGEGLSDEEIEAKKKAEAARQARLAQLGQGNAKDKATVSDTGGPIRNLEARASDPNREIDTSVTVVSGGEHVGTADEGDVVGKIGEVPVGAQTPADRTRDEDIPPQAIIDAKLETIRQFVPGFEWDMEMQWAKRAKLAVEKYGENLPVLNAILSIETPTVKKHIMKRLYGDD